jgi:hypothetical protein
LESPVQRDFTPLTPQNGEEAGSWASAFAPLKEAENRRDNIPLLRDVEREFTKVTRAAISKYYKKGTKGIGPHYLIRGSVR